MNPPAQAACHLCAGWYRALAAVHLARHGLIADEYRRLVGLSPRTPLIARGLSELRARQMRHRMEHGERVRDGMRIGIALARSGAMQARARALAADDGPRLQRVRQLAHDGGRLRRSRAEAFRAARERRARNAGFPTLDAFFRERYERQRARIEDLQRELGASYSAVRGDLACAGIEVRRDARRRGRSERRERMPS